jgi:hypothetical protein
LVKFATPKSSPQSRRTSMVMLLAAVSTATFTPLAPIPGTHTPARIPLATASTEAGAILVRGASARRSLHALRLCDGEEDGADAKLQKLLDTPLIDPTQDNADDPEFLRRFKQLVNDDYNFAEALYAGGVFAVLLFFSQQGVSVYKHCVAMPDAACPWASGSVDAFSNFPT